MLLIAIASAVAIVASAAASHTAGGEQRWCRNGTVLSRGHWTQDTHVWELGIGARARKASPIAANTPRLRSR